MTLVTKIRHRTRPALYSVFKILIARGIQRKQNIFQDIEHFIPLNLTSTIR